MTYVPEADLVIAGNDEEGVQPSIEALARDFGLVRTGSFRRVGIRRRKMVTYPSRHGVRTAVIFGEFWHRGARSDGVRARSYRNARGRPLDCDPRKAGAGLVVDGAPEIFGPALASLLADQSKCARMGAAGARAAREKFTWEAIAERMESVYSECVATKHKQCLTRSRPYS